MPDTLNENVATEVRAEMARQRLSQWKLAELLGRSQPWLSRRLVGGVPFDLDDVQIIAGVLGVPVSQFIPQAAKAASS